MITFIDQCGKCESFGRAPVDARATVDRCIPRLEDLADLWVEFALRGQQSDLVTDLAEDGQVNACIFDVAVALRVHDFLPLRINPILCVKLQVL